MKSTFHGVIFAALALCGCHKNASTFTLSVELNASPRSGDCASNTDPFPSSATCIEVTACTPSATGCVAYPLYRASTAHNDEGASALRFTRSDAANLQFDARPTTTPIRLSVRAYASDGSLVADGVTGNVTFGAGQQALVRLAPVQSWSCAPSHADGTPLFPRGLHAMQMLGDGSVLIFGGVAGDAIDVAGLGVVGAVGAATERRIERYVPSEHRFEQLTVNGDFGRVGFASAVLSATASQTRIRVYGGYDAMAGAAILFDGAQRASESGLPLVPSPAAMIGATVDLIYDASSNSISVAMVAPAQGVAEAFALSASGPSNEVVVAGGFDSFVAANSPSVVPANAASFFGADGAALGTPGMLSVARAFGSLTRIGSDGAPAWIAWGGVVGATDYATTSANAGEIFSRTGGSQILASAAPDRVACPSSTPAAGPGVLPLPTAFHASAAIGTDAALISGGFLTSSTGCDGRGILPIASGDPLFVLAAGVDAPVHVTTAPGTTYEPTALAAAAPVSSSVADGLVMLVGGIAVASSVPTADAQLRASANSYLVSANGGSGGAVSYTISATKPLLNARWGHAVIRLTDGNMLVTGGFARASGTSAHLVTLATAEIFNPRGGLGHGGAICSDIPFNTDAGTGAVVVMDAGPVADSATHD